MVVQWVETIDWSTIHINCLLFLILMILLIHLLVYNHKQYLEEDSLEIDRFLHKVLLMRWLKEDLIRIVLLFVCNLFFVRDQCLLNYRIHRLGTHSSWGI
jgi:hypothetical protein